MRLFNELVFDGYVTTTYPVRTSPLFYELLGEAEQLVLHAECDEVQGSPAVLSVVVEHSPDGENWAAKTSPVLAASLSAGSGQIVTGVDAGLVPSSDRVRLRLALSGAAPSAHVQLFASGRNTARIPGLVWCADLTGFAPGAIAQLPGSLQFSRSSVATVQTSANTVQTSGLGNDVPRAGNDGTHAGLVLEESRTNLIPDSRTMSGTGWNAGLTVTTKEGFAAGPDGQVVAVRSQVSASGYSNYQFFTIGTTATYALSQWVLEGGASGPFQLRTEKSAVVTDGAVVTGTATASWQRATVLFAFTSGDSSFPVPVDARDNSAIGGLTAQALDNGTDLYQFEQGAFATEAIVTAGATATRAGEHLSHPDVGALLDAGRLGLEVRLQPKGDVNAYASAMRLWTLDASNYAEVDPATKKLTVVVGGVAWTPTTAVTWSAGDTLEVFVEAGGGALVSRAQYRVNGGAATSLGASGSAQGSMAAHAGKAVDLLCNGATSQLSAWVQWLAAYAAGARPGWAQ